MTINIPSYNYGHELVEDLRAIIDERYSEIFECVLVHGSFATNEVINFSDFDGLIVVKDEYKDSRELRTFLKESMREIYKFDPLQHHSWFQITDHDLINYPQCYLPVEVLNYAKVIYPLENTYDLHITDLQDCDYLRSLTSVVNGLRSELRFDWKHKNTYDLKSHLSKIMLLPSLYYSVKNSKGVFKKESFDLVRNEFSSEEWQVIDSASQLRKDWNYNLPKHLRFVLNLPNKINRKLIKHFFAPKPNMQSINYLNSDFRSQLELFLNAINNKTG